MRCLSKITDMQGNEFNLMQINDFSVITSEIQGKGVAETRIYQQSSHSVPSWITVQGDKIFSASTMSSDEKYLVNDDYTLIAYNHITVGGDNFYGTAMYNKLNSNARAGGGGDSNPSSYGLDQWLGIVLDDDNQRAYLIFATDKYNAGSNNYYRVYVETGNYNGTDIYWETFGEVILNQSAGGGGYYGGYKGGAGSGYIGNSALSNKKMVGYNVPTSSAESTYTESTNQVSGTPTSDKAKSGNGFVRIKFLREAKWVTLKSILKDASGLDSHYKKSSIATPSLNATSIADLSSYFGTDWTLKGGTGTGILYSDGVFKNQIQNVSDTWFFPLKKTYKFLGFRGSAKVQDKGSQWDLMTIRSCICNGNTIQDVGENVVIGKAPTDDDTYGTYRFVEVTGNDCNDFSWTLDHFMGATGQYGTDVNYIMLGMATRLEWIKDLECLVIEEG